MMAFSKVVDVVKNKTLNKAKEFTQAVGKKLPSADL